MPMPTGVLQPEQLAEISRLLGQYKGHWEQSKEADSADKVNELIGVLQNFQSRYVK